MSIKRMNAVWEHSQQQKAKLLILLSLADRADNDGYCWPARKDIAERSRCSERYVTKAIKEIEADGELIINERTGSTHQFIVCVGMSEEEKQQTIARRFKGGEPSSGVNPSSRGVEPQFQGGVNPSSTEPSITVKEPSTMHTQRSSLLSDYAKEFGNFPNKQGVYSGEDLAQMLIEAFENVGENEWPRMIEWSKMQTYKHYGSRVKAILTASQKWGKQKEQEEQHFVGRVNL